MGATMKSILLVPRWFLFAAIKDPRPENDGTHPRNTTFILLHESNGLIFVTDDVES